MDLREFLENQIKKGNINWRSKSELVRASGNNISGNNAKIIKEYENKFQFGSEIEIKNKEILKYFNAQPKNSFISVEGAAKKIQAKLPDKIIISETIIYNRLKDPKFNKNNLKPQTLDNQVSKTAPYKVKITDELKNKMKQLREPGIYLYLEVTQSGNNTLRLKLSGELFENSDTSYPPNLNSLKLIEQKIKDSRK